MRRSLIIGAILFCLAGTTHAQGLIWKLPEDRTWVRYEGTLKQTTRRPDSAEGDIVLEWRRHLTIKSVGREDASYQGQVQACRWIEIKSETGKTTEGLLQGGPGSVIMYRLLVPESVVKGELTAPLENGREIFVSFLPVIKGERRLGTEPAQQIDPALFQGYPLISLLRNYRELETISSQNNSGEAVYRGELITETPVYRSSNRSEITRSENSAFGLQKWFATTINESKASVEERAEFREETILEEEMQAVLTGYDAESDFVGG